MSLITEKYSDEWFLMEFPEYIRAYTREEWAEKFHKFHHNNSPEVVAAAIENSIRIFGLRDGEENDFGVICP